MAFVYFLIVFLVVDFLRIAVRHRLSFDVVERDACLCLYICYLTQDWSGSYIRNRKKLICIRKWKQRNPK